MKNSITVISLDENDSIIDEKLLSKPNTYEKLVISISEIFNYLNFEIFILTTENEKKLISSEEDFQIKSSQYYVIKKDKIDLGLSLYSDVFSNLSESKQDIFSDKFCCPLCGDRINDNPYFCYQCQYMICKGCMEKLKEKNKTKIIKCPKCNNECLSDNWKTLKNFNENQKNELELLNKITSNKKNYKQILNIKDFEIRKLYSKMKEYEKKYDELKIIYEEALKKNYVIIKEKDEKINELKNYLDKFKCFDERGKNKNNEIVLTLVINEEDVNQKIYFLDNTDGDYYENGVCVSYHHDGLKILNENNTNIFINDKQINFNKFFIPETIGSYEIKIVFKANLISCNYMFCDCINIFKINLSSFNTQNVAEMNYMFSGCSNLSNIDLLSFDTLNVTDMSFMFNQCNNLENIDLSSFNTKNLINTSHMFSYCTNLKNIVLSSFDTQNVINMVSMFSHCSKLTNIDITSFKIKDTAKINYMFYSCFNLKNIKINKEMNEKINKVLPKNISIIN